MAARLLSSYTLRMMSHYVIAYIVAYITAYCLRHADVTAFQQQRHKEGGRPRPFQF